jgi:2-keto-4-pentenoate hydratase/2-oxohepta-3-ene-1,7-dioic acid hydratase in catechol pathway
MKLAAYKSDGGESVGVLTGKGIVDIPTNWPGTSPPRNIIDILRRDEIAKAKELVNKSGIIIPVENVKFLAPISRPGKLLALAGNYGEHIKEASQKRGFNLGLSEAKKQTTVPRPFLKPSTTIIGPDEPIPWPAYSEQIDYELELAVVIGRHAKCINSKEAIDCVAGYAIANDVSARSVTFKNGRMERPWDDFYDWLAGKWADGFCPMGPYLVTADEIPDVQNLNMELKVNNETRQKANTNQMIYPVADIVSFLSFIMTLEPGDIILTGTPAGVAVATGRFLQTGDKIECRIENLGVLKNTLTSKPDDFYRPLG